MSVDEKGRPLVVNDAIADELKNAAERESKEAGTFLSLEKFGDLAMNPQICQAFGNFLKKIRAHGIRECVKEINAKFNN